MKKIIIILFSIIVLVSFFGEKIHNEAAGFDGQTYRNIMLNAQNINFKQEFSSYYVMKAAPWIFGNFILELLDAPYSNNNGLKIALILNGLSLLLSVFFFFKIVKLKEYSAERLLLAFILIFFSFFILKFIGYYPFVNDLFAFSAMIVAYYYWVRKNKIALFFISILMLFTWNLSFVILSALIFLPDTPINLTKGNYRFKILHHLSKVSIPILFLLAAALIAFYSFYTLNLDYLAIAYTYRKGDNIPLIILSTLAFSVFLFFISKYFGLNPLAFLRSNLKMSIIVKAGLFLIVIAVPVLLVKFISNPSIAAPVPFKTTLIRVLGEPMIFPLQFLEANFLYFGCFIIFLISGWKNYLKHIEKFGLAYLPLFFSFLLLAFQSESRFIVAALPFVAFALMDEIDESKINLLLVKKVLLIQLVVSAFYIPLNLETTHAQFSAGEYFKFPAQLFFLHQGPWQTFASYLIGSTLLVLAYWWIKPYKFFKPTT